MVSFSQMKDMYRLQKEAKRIKKELKNVHVEAESEGVKVVVTAEEESVEIRVSPDRPPDRIGPAVKDALNRALKKAQVIAAERMQGIMGEMGLPTGPAA